MKNDKSEADRIQEAELIELVRETVAQLHIMGDRLEHYAESRIPSPREGEHSAGTTASRSTRPD